ncbi:MAG: Txe/YoeB family addiction module toxin [Oliverpabstia sp.]|nr:Txe/YoeB family addiction module toxin [Eubacterium sp.]MDY2596214.1 Txe/YoeB family addiction module toxin [Oliverpabstia sp.]
MYTIRFSKQADKDKKLLKAAGLERKTKELLNIISQNPFQNPPPYEKLVGNLDGLYSRRINIQHRLVYEVIDDSTIFVRRMWTHYENN